MTFDIFLTLDVLPAVLAALLAESLSADVARVGGLLQVLLWGGVIVLAPLIWPL
jgi:hypothetical protein